MRKFLLAIFLLLFLFLSLNSHAISPAILVDIVAGAAPDCSEYFTTGDTGDVAGNTNFDSETDASSKLAITSNTLSYTCDGTNIAYVVETGCVADTDIEQTIEFDIRFADITDVNNGADDFYVLRLYNDANSTPTGDFIFQTDVSGNLKYYKCRAYMDGSNELSSSVDISGTVAANTWYHVTCYIKVDGAAGGVSMKIGAWAVTDTGFNDDNDWASGGAGSHRFGAPTTTWGDGGSGSFLIDTDDYEVRKYDAR